MKYRSIFAGLLLGFGALACNQENQAEPMTPASALEKSDPSPGLDTKSGEPTPANTEPSTGPTEPGTSGASPPGTETQSPASSGER